MILIPILALAASASDQPSAQQAPIIRRNEVHVETARLRFPAEIERPLSDYGNCLSASNGRLPPWFPNPPVKPGGDCSKFREKAADDADHMLKRSTELNSDQRREVIETNLKNVEAFMAGLPIPYPSADNLPSEPLKPN